MYILYICISLIISGYNEIEEVQMDRESIRAAVAKSVMSLAQQVPEVGLIAMCVYMIVYVLEAREGLTIS